MLFRNIIHDNLFNSEQINYKDNIQITSFYFRTNVELYNKVTKGRRLGLIVAWLVYTYSNLSN